MKLRTKIVLGIMLGLCNVLIGSYNALSLKNKRIIKKNFQHVANHAKQFDSNLTNVWIKFPCIATLSNKLGCDLWSKSIGEKLTHSVQEIETFKHGIGLLSTLKKLHPLRESIIKCFGHLSDNLKKLKESVEEVPVRYPYVQEEKKIALQDELKEKLRNIIQFKSSLWQALQNPEKEGLTCKDTSEINMLVDLKKKLSDTKKRVTFKPEVPLWMEILQGCFDDENSLEDMSKALKGMLRSIIRNKKTHKKIFKSSESPLMRNFLRYFLKKQQQRLIDALDNLHLVDPSLKELWQKVLRGESQWKELLLWFIPYSVTILNTLTLQEQADFEQNLDEWLDNNNVYAEYKNLIKYIVKNQRLRKAIRPEQFFIEESQGDDSITIKKLDPEFRKIIINIMHDKTAWPSIIPWLIEKGIVQSILNSLDTKDSELQISVESLLEKSEYNEYKELILHLLKEDNVQEFVKELIGNNEFQKKLKEAVQYLMSQPKIERQSFKKMMQQLKKHKPDLLNYLISYQPLGALIQSVNNAKFRQMLSDLLLGSDIPYSGIISFSSPLSLKAASYRPMRSFAGAFLLRASPDQKYRAPENKNQIVLPSDYNLFSYLNLMTQDQFDFGLDSDEEKGRKKIIEDEKEEYEELEGKTKIEEFTDRILALEGKKESINQALSELQCRKEMEEAYLWITPQKEECFKNQKQQLKKRLKLVKEELANVSEIVNIISADDLGDDIVQMLAGRYVEEMYQGSSNTFKLEAKACLLKFIQEHLGKKRILLCMQNILSVPGLSKKDNNYFDLSEDFPYKVFRLWVRAELNKEIENSGCLLQFYELEHNIPELEKDVNEYEELAASCEKDCSDFQEQINKAKTWRFSKFFSRFLPTKLLAKIGNYIKSWWNCKFIRQNEHDCQTIAQTKQEALSKKEESEGSIAECKNKLQEIKQTSVMQIVGLLFKKTNDSLNYMKSQYFDKELDQADYKQVKLLAAYSDSLFEYCISPEFRLNLASKDVEEAEERISPRGAGALFIEEELLEEEED